MPLESSLLRSGRRLSALAGQGCEVSVGKRSLMSTRRGSREPARTLRVGSVQRANGASIDSNDHGGGGQGHQDVQHKTRLTIGACAADLRVRLELHRSGFERRAVRCRTGLQRQEALFEAAADMQAHGFRGPRRVALWLFHECCSIARWTHSVVLIAVGPRRATESCNALSVRGTGCARPHRSGRATPCSPARTNRCLRNASL